MILKNIQIIILYMKLLTKGNKNESKQFILFNLNNFNDSDKNKNNNVITIYTSPNYKRNYFN